MIEVKPDGCVGSKSCQDFPSDPIMDGVTQADIGGFSDPNNLGGAATFCLMEPQLAAGSTPGAMFPANWLTPRFRWDNGAAGAVVEIRMKADVESHELVVYTKSDHWIMPQQIWNVRDMNGTLINGLGNNARHVDVTVRQLAGGTMTNMQGSFEIAPVNAGGTMVYWGTTSSLVSPTSSFLVGFSVGDPAVARALTLNQVNGAGPAGFGQILNENGKDLRGQYDQATDPNSTIAKGFMPGQVQCIGCHIQLPDKSGVIFTDDWPWNKIVAATGQGVVGTTPDYVSAGARAILKQPGTGITTAASASAAPMLWGADHKVIVTSYYQDLAVTGDVHRRVPFGPAIDDNKGIPPAERLIWIDLATTANIPDKYGGTANGLDSQLQNARNAGIAAAQHSAWDYIPVNGETMPANILPNLSADGSLLVYTAANASQNGGLHKSRWVEADLHFVPFNGGQGGDAKPVPGASDPNVMEYYPAWSPDHQLIAFTRVQDTNSAGYYNPFGEINVVDGSGPRTRLVANDPPACSGEHSPGVFNSWPKWAPNVKTGPDKKDYYFVIFSSARRYPNPVDLGVNINNPGVVQKPSQLYVATVVRDPANGQITTYPAIYLWNQGYEQQGTGAGATANIFRTNNLTPAWDKFATSIPITIDPGMIR